MDQGHYSFAQMKDKETVNLGDDLDDVIAGVFLKTLM